LLSNFAAELCNYHKQNYLTKKQQEATHQLLTRGCARRLKTTTIYEEKNKKEKKKSVKTPHHDF